MPIFKFFQQTWCEITSPSYLTNRRIAIASRWSEKIPKDSSQTSALNREPQGSTHWKTVLCYSHFQSKDSKSRRLHNSLQQTTQTTSDPASMNNLNQQGLVGDASPWANHVLTISFYTSRRTTCHHYHFSIPLLQDGINPAFATLPHLGKALPALTGRRLFFA